jgi:2-haloalkanoic acid dehalogenase type II
VFERTKNRRSTRGIESVSSHQPPATSHAVMRKYEAVLFDLLTALIDSWTLWDETAGSAERGRAWRAEYLKLTYGCGAYRPYEILVTEAAESVGLKKEYADRLESQWTRLQPWPEAPAVLAGLAQTHKLGVVTNCSERLGRRAAARVSVPFDVVVTAERAGHYKPDVRPYQMALDELGMTAAQTLFVSGSAYDLFGTARLGLDTYWHNRVGMTAPTGAPRAMIERPTLSELPAVAGRTT